MQTARLLVSALTAITICLHVPLAHADSDSIAALAATISKSASEKQRLAAVLSLAKISDRATVKPLVNALRDPSAKVRVAAVVALGRLGHKSSLPALRESRNDSDDLVRKQATIALSAVNKANGLTDDDASTAAPAVEAVTNDSANKAGFGNKPRALAPQAELYVLINTSNDDSPGRLDDAARKVHGDVLRAAMKSQLTASKVVSSNASDVAKLGIAARHLDLSVVKLEAGGSGNYIEIEAQLRLAISDSSGKILSMISGGAKVQVLRKIFNAKNMSAYRKEALESAVAGLFGKLLTHLRKSAQT
jgi:hypothetical protein